MMPYVLITRPEEDTLALAAAVQAKGYTPFIAPMLKIVPQAVTLPSPADYQALVFTSANGARVFATISEDRHHPVYCTGDFTADTARALGWQDVYSAGGDAEDLITLLKEAGLEREKPLLHPAGAHIAKAIEVPGLTIARLVVYRADKTPDLSPVLLDILDQGALAAALFFSARTARTFAELLEKNGRTGAVRATKALCLGDSMVKSLRQLDWQDVQVAETPDRNGLLSLLEKMPPEND